MKLIVGLGNPGQRYSRTRHNVGFMAVDALATRWEAGSWRRKFEAEVVEAKVDGEAVLLVKPQTYMNLSGESVGAIQRWYKLEVEDIIAIYDDMDIPVGQAKLKKRGSSGGHRGVESLLVNLGKEDFARVKIGVGRPLPGWQVVDHVLADFPAGDFEEIERILAQVGPTVECIIKRGIDQAMSRCSFKPRRESKQEKEGEPV